MPCWRRRWPSSGPRRTEPARAIARELIERFSAAGLKDALDESFMLDRLLEAGSGGASMLAAQPDPRAQAMLDGLRARGARSVFVRYLERLGGHPSADAVLAAITTTLGWGPLMRKRVSRLTVECLPAWMQLFGTLIGASVDASRHEPTRFCGIDEVDLLGRRSLTEVAYVALLHGQPREGDLFAFQTLVGLLLSNGPGTISAQGAKGAVSSDGPEQPERVQLNKGLVGFLTHCGYAHGGNGYEGVAFLLEQFKDSGLADPGDPAHGLDVGGARGALRRVLRALQGRARRPAAISTSRRSPASTTRCSRTSRSITIRARSSSAS